MRNDPCAPTAVHPYPVGNRQQWVERRPRAGYQVSDFRSRVEIERLVPAMKVGSGWRADLALRREGSVLQRRLQCFAPLVRNGETRPGSDGIRRYCLALDENLRPRLAFGGLFGFFCVPPAENFS